MLTVILAFCFFLYPVSQSSVATVSYSVSVPQIESSLSSIKNGSQDTTEPSAIDIQPPRTTLSPKMKDFLNFIDFRANGKWVSNISPKDTKLIVDLDQTNINILGKGPQEAVHFRKEIVEEGIVVDIPKSSLFRRQKSCCPGMESYLKGFKLPVEYNNYNLPSNYGIGSPLPHSVRKKYQSTEKYIKRLYNKFFMPFKKNKVPSEGSIYAFTINKRHNDSIPLLRIINQVPTTQDDKGCNFKKNYKISHYSFPRTRVPQTLGQKYKMAPTRNVFPNNILCNHFTAGPVVSFSQVFTPSSPLKESQGCPFCPMNLSNITAEIDLHSFIKKLSQSSVKTIITEPTINTRKYGSILQHDKNKSIGIKSTEGNSGFQLAVIVAKVTNGSLESYLEDNTSITNDSLSVLTDESKLDDELSSTFRGTKRTSLKPEKILDFELDKKSHTYCIRNFFSTDNNTNSLESEITFTNSYFESIETPDSIADPINKRIKGEKPRHKSNSLLKEIMRHVSIALDEVTTSKEFLTLLSRETEFYKTSSGRKVVSDATAFDKRSFPALPRATNTRKGVAEAITKHPSAISCGCLSNSIQSSWPRGRESSTGVGAHHQVAVEVTASHATSIESLNLATDFSASSLKSGHTTSPQLNFDVIQKNLKDICSKLPHFRTDAQTTDEYCNYSSPESVTVSRLATTLGEIIFCDKIKGNHSQPFGTEEATEFFTNSQKEISNLESYDEMYGNTKNENPLSTTPSSTINEESDEEEEENDDDEIERVSSADMFKYSSMDYIGAVEEGGSFERMDKMTLPKIKKIINRNDETLDQLKETEGLSTYRAEQLIRKLKEYHEMLRNGNITEIWNFIKMSTEGYDKNSVTFFGHLINDELAKNNCKMSMRYVHRKRPKWEYYSKSNKVLNKKIGYNYGSEKSSSSTLGPSCAFGVTQNVGEIQSNVKNIQQIPQGSGFHHPLKAQVSKLITPLAKPMSYNAVELAAVSSAKGKGSLDGPLNWLLRNIGRKRLADAAGKYLVMT